MAARQQKTKPSSAGIAGLHRSNSVPSVNSSGNCPIAASLHGLTLAGLEASMIVDSKYNLNPDMLEPRLLHVQEVEHGKQLTENYQLSFADHMRKRQSTLYPISGTQQKMHEALHSRQRSCSVTSLPREDNYSCRSRPSSQSIQQEKCVSRRSSEWRNLERFWADQISCASEACNFVKDSKKTRSTLHAFAGAMVVSAT